MKTNQAEQYDLPRLFENMEIQNALDKSMLRHRNHQECWRSGITTEMTRTMKKVDGLEYQKHHFASLITGALIGTLSDAGEIGSAAIDAVKRICVTALHDTSEVTTTAAQAARDITGAAIHTAVGVGADSGTAVNHAIHGLIHGVSDVGGDLGTTIEHAAIGAIKATNEVGGDLGKSAVAIVRGTIAATAQVGGDVGQVSERAVKGVLDGAGKISQTAVGTVSGALKSSIVEAQDIVHNAMKKRVLPTYRTSDEQ